MWSFHFFNFDNYHEDVKVIFKILFHLMNISFSANRFLVLADHCNLVLMDQLSLCAEESSVRSIHFDDVENFVQLSQCKLFV